MYDTKKRFELHFGRISKVFGRFFKTKNWSPRFQAILSNGFAFSLIWNVLENGYLEPHNVSRVDFNKERGRVRSTFYSKTRLRSTYLFYLPFFTYLFLLENTFAINSFNAYHFTLDIKFRTPLLSYYVQDVEPL
jgi:hypothetical protein